MNDVTLLSALVESRGEEGWVRLSGEPSAAAIVGAVIANYHRILDRPRPRDEDLAELVGEKVTLVSHGENMIGAGLIKAREGRIFEGRNGGFGILPKGKRSKGYRVDAAHLLDVLPGWRADVAQQFVDMARDHFPHDLVNLTQERLEELPRDSNTCSLAVFGGNRLFGAHDCVWLIGEYWPEDDICDTNVLLIRPEFGESEHGSCYGRDLLSNRALGEIVGFEPISFKEAIALCNLDFDEALASVIDRTTITA